MVGLLIVLAMSVFITSPLSIQISPSEKGTFVVALNVCHVAGYAISSNADTPLVCECLCRFHTSALAGFIDISDHYFHPNVLSFRLERPPKV